MLLFFLISLNITFLFSQDKTISIDIKKKNKFVGYENTRNGLFYIVSGKDKGRKSEIKIDHYDQDLNLIYTKGLPKSDYQPLPAFFGRGMNSSPIYYDLFATNNGKYLISNIDRMVIDKEGKHTSFNFEEDEETKDITEFFTFYSDEYACYLGKVIDQKSKNKDNNIYFFRRSLKDYSTKKVALEIPPIKTTKNKIEFGLHSFDDNGFYIINKILDMKSSTDTYNVINYNYEGELISSNSIKVALNKKYFSTSSNGFGSSTIVFNNSFSFHKLHNNATGNIYIDNLKQEYYVFGLYSNKKDFKLYNARNNGFYVNKYTFKGDLIWSTIKKINDRDYNKNSVSYNTSLHFFDLKNNQKGIRISNTKHDYSFMFLLNNDDGEVTKNKKVKFKISPIKLNGIRGGSFPTGYSNREFFGKNNLDVDVPFAALISPKVDAFFKSVKNKQKNYNSFILDTGIYILEENTKDKSFKLMKFNY